MTFRYLLVFPQPVGCCELTDWLIVFCANKSRGTSHIVPVLLLPGCSILKFTALQLDDWSQLNPKKQSELSNLVWVSLISPVDKELPSVAVVIGPLQTLL